MAKWYVAAKKADFEAIANKYQIDPVIARIIRNRDIIEENEIEAFLNPQTKNMHSPFLLKDMKVGIDLIHEKIAKGKKICVIGDYDIDGICSSYILQKSLEYLKAEVDVMIPHRMKDGYGINEDLIQEAYEKAADTIITCDNGIAAKEQIDYAKKLGMTVIITDHHEVPFEEVAGEKQYILPNADVIINPKQPDCTYPFSGICGGMVAFKVAQALLLEEKSNHAKELLEELTEIAAFATIGDIMELKDENRILVKQGLCYLQKSRNIGIQALKEVTGIEGKKLSPYHVGFVLGPCLNATGRLDSALVGLKLLNAKDRSEAASLAGDLKALNDSRKELTQKGVLEAIAQVEESDWKEDKVYVLYLPNCHESLAGIIAGRIREKYTKPTFVLTKGEDAIKGSGRSIEAFSMYEEMNKHKNLFLKFGGHKLAAGLSLEEKNIELFRAKINEDNQLTKEDLEEKIHIDVPMPISYISKDFIKQLEVLEPFGNGNGKPVFAQKNISFYQENRIGKEKSIAKFVVADESGRRMNLIYFGDLEAFHTYIETKYGEQTLHDLWDGKAEGVKLSVVYYPTINEFRGSEEIQLVMEDYQ